MRFAIIRSGWKRRSLGLPIWRNLQILANDGGHENELRLRWRRRTSPGKRPISYAIRTGSATLQAYGGGDRNTVPEVLYKAYQPPGVQVRLPLGAMCLSGRLRDIAIQTRPQPASNISITGRKCQSIFIWRADDSRLHQHQKHARDTGFRTSRYRYQSRTLLPAGLLLGDALKFRLLRCH